MNKKRDFNSSIFLFLMNRLQPYFMAMGIIDSIFFLGSLRKRIKKNCIRKEKEFSVRYLLVDDGKHQQTEPGAMSLYLY